MQDDKYEFGTYSSDDAEFKGAEADDGFPINPDWLRLTSVGIDIGSSTSHLMFSRLIMRRRGRDLSGEFEIVRRDVLHRSPILLTPYSDPDTIDTAALSAFVRQSYADAGIAPQNVDTGAVICTGEAVRKHNSEAIIRMLAAEGGKFVCATAGPNLEAILGAHGSGAVARSQEGGRILNVDVGGGTAKLAIVEGGAVRETMAINVGARLVAWDEAGIVQRTEAAGRAVARDCGFDVSVGRPITEEQKQAIAERLAEILFEALARKGLSELAQGMVIAGALDPAGELTEICFSGGVSEYIYAEDSRDYGDLGPWLGDAVRRRLPQLGIPLAGSLERIRATVIGASQYTIQVSSSTVHVSRKDLLPQFDLQVVPIYLPEASPSLSATAVAEAIRAGFSRLDLVVADVDRPVAPALIGNVFPSRGSIQALCTGIMEALSGLRDQPWVIVLSADIAGLVGVNLRELGAPADIVIVDGIRVGDFNFIDLGKMIDTHEAVPVVVKSLVFEG